jgi:TP901 family phage tail tape measure protein
VALEKLGLGGTLTFDSSRAVQGMNAARAAFTRMGASATSTVAKLNPLESKVGRSAVAMAASLGGKAVAAVRALDGALGQLQVEAMSSSVAMKAEAEAAKEVATSSGRARDATGRFVAGARQAKTAVTDLSSGLRRLKQDFQGIGGNVATMGRNLGQALQGLGMAAAPATLALGAAMRTAVGFESQMGRVSAVTLASAEDLATMQARARELGATTTFTATESAEAMEQMARAGANTSQILGGISGVMDAAAAEGMGLAQATEIVGITAATTGNTWNESAHIADVLALASARTQSSIASLGEAFSYGGLQAHTAGMTLEETAAILGILHNAGLQGSTAGTSLQNALLALADPTDEANKLLQRWNITMSTTATGGVDLMGIVEQLQSHISQLPTAMERTAAANEIMGIRGGRAFAALAMQGTAAVTELRTALNDSSNFEGTGVGAAATMAQRQLANLGGAWRLFTSAVEGAVLSVFMPMLQPLAAIIAQVSEFIGKVVTGVDRLTTAGADMEARWIAMSGILEENGPMILNVVAGVKDAMDDIKWAIDGIKEGLQGVAEMFGTSLGGDGIRTLTRFALLFVVVLGVIGPVALAIAGIGFVITSVVIPAITAIGAGFAAVGGIIGGPFLAILAVVGLAFATFRTEGESFGDTMGRLWDVIKTKAMGLWNDVLVPLWNGITTVLGPAFEMIGDIWDEIGVAMRGLIDEVMSLFDATASNTETNWTAIGEYIGGAIALIGSTISAVIYGVIQTIRGIVWVLNLVKSVFQGVGEFIKGTVTVIINHFRTLWNSVKQVATGVRQIFSGDVMAGLRNLGMGLLNFVLAPLRTITNQVINLASSLGAGGLIPQSVRDFAADGGSERLFAEPANQAPRIRRAAPPGAPSGAEGEARLGDQALWNQHLNNSNRGAPPAIDLTATVNDNSTRTVESTVCVDGRTVATATSRHQQEVSDRAGFRSTPWDRRIRAEQGAVRVQSAS